MSYSLISEEEYLNLPEEDDQCFVQFESVCQRNMMRLIDENSSNDFDVAVRQQYMAAVAAVAAECHVPNIQYERDTHRNIYEAFGQFSLAVQGEVARIRIRSRGVRHPYSVLLTSSTRTKIEHYISRIRDTVERSDLDADRKQRLRRRLDQLVTELGATRLSFAKTMGILAAVLATAGSSVTIAVDGQNAVAHIMQLIGHDKQSENAAAKRLTPPLKALPAPALKPQPPQMQSLRPTAKNRDDDIPF